MVHCKAKDLEKEHWSLQWLSALTAHKHPCANNGKALHCYVSGNPVRICGKDYILLRTNSVLRMRMIALIIIKKLVNLNKITEYKIFKSWDFANHFYN